MATPPPSTAKPPKSMSSRLLTMKFMQRAAASTPAPSPTPSTPDEPSPKRQKLGADSSPSGTEARSADLRAVQAAVAAEEAKREEALERQAKEAGETKWFLSFRPEERECSAGHGDRNGRGAIRVMSTSYSGLDHESVSVDQDQGSFRPAAVVGRRSFGRFNLALEKRLNGNDEASSSSGDDTSEGANNVDNDEDDPTETNDLIRASRDEATQRAKAERKAQRRAAKAEAARLAEKRKSKEVKLNKLGSISNGGNAVNQNVECFNCGGKGHRKNECPQPRRKEKRKKGG